MSSETPVRVSKILRLRGYEVTALTVLLGLTLISTVIMFGRLVNGVLPILVAGALVGSLLYGLMRLYRRAGKLWLRFNGAGDSGGGRDLLKIGSLSLFFYASTLLFPLAILAMLWRPDGVGQGITNWLWACGRDANIIKEASSPPASIVAVVRSSLALFTCLGLWPLSIRFASFATSLLSRLAVSPSWGRLGEAFVETLHIAPKKLLLREAHPFMKNAARSFWWLIGSYITIFLLIGFCPGPLGIAIQNWLDFASVDAGFPAYFIYMHPTVRVFLASMIALWGAVPLAVTACVFLPPTGPRYLHVHQDGLLVEHAGAWSMQGRPLRLWEDVEQVSLSKCRRGRNPEKRTLSIKFATGGTLRFKLSQMSRVDLAELLAAVDEQADHCALDAEVLSLRGQLADTARRADGRRDDKPVGFSSTVFTPLPPGHRFEGRGIRIVKLIATKPLCAVYLTRLDDGRLAVLKQFVVPDDSPEAGAMRKQFKRECALLSELAHPQVAHLLDTFHEEPSDFVLIEHIKGLDLRSLVQRGGPRTEAFVRDIASQLCAVMSHLHGKQPAVLHRDLTPDNIVLTEQGTVRLIDFGAAHQFLEGITGTIIGKQSFVSPEQLRGKASPGSDIYSFGATLHFLLTGREPRALKQCDPRDCGIAVSESLAGLIIDCTAFEESDRPKSFMAIQSALNDFPFTRAIHTKESGICMAEDLPAEDSWTALAQDQPPSEEPAVIWKIPERMMKQHD